MDFKKTNIELIGGKKIYFASDFHLGVPSRVKSLEREERICSWLDEIKKDAQVVFLVGDIFDFWFEYRHVIPKGFLRVQSKILSLIDSGVEFVFFTGNHDMWMFDYFTQELGVKIERNPVIYQIGNKRFLVGHGDGLGKGDYSYKFLKSFFNSKICQFLFSWLHPDIGMGLANYWSSKSRLANSKKDEDFSLDKEILYHYSKSIYKETKCDCYIYGHRHLPLDINLETEKNSRYINLGEWVNYSPYAVFNGETIALTKF